MARYRIAFHMLWRLKRVEWSLSGSWKQLMSFSHARGEEPLPALKSVLHRHVHCTSFHEFLEWLIYLFLFFCQLFSSFCCIFFNSFDAIILYFCSESFCFLFLLSFYYHTRLLFSVLITSLLHFFL